MPAIYTEEEAVEKMLGRNQVVRAEVRELGHVTNIDVEFTDGRRLKAENSSSKTSDLPSERSGRYLVRICNVPPWGEKSGLDGETVGRQRLREVVGAISRFLELPFEDLTAKEEGLVKAMREDNFSQNRIVRRIASHRVHRGKNVLVNMRRVFYAERAYSCEEEALAYRSAEGLVRAALEAKSEE
jgi:hypothetical protein